MKTHIYLLAWQQKSFLKHQKHIDLNKNSEIFPLIYTPARNPKLWNILIDRYLINYSSLIFIKGGV